MKQNEVDRIAKGLVDRYGLALKIPVRLSSDGQSFILEPDGYHRNESFQIEVQLGWRSIEMHFQPGKFAAELIEGMGEADGQKKLLFSAIAGEITRLRGILTFTLNGLATDPSSGDTWAQSWRSLTFSVRRSPIDINTEDHSLTEKLVGEWLELFYTAIISISPLEEVVDAPDVEGLPEGAVARVEVNRYERSRINRSICLSHHGTSREVCELDYGVRYGEIGYGYIHVHHVTPVSQLGPNYLINPVSDLVPVCPNCHAMLHRRNPPYSIDELKTIGNLFE